ncbi:MAG TPA: C25 family cysteine peptidase, partial [Candidatus Deferrimicrobium sp.]|nr:C25 family cysteine peptidase [Candidatus Deferrimicrobium sp.]
MASQEKIVIVTAQKLLLALTDYVRFKEQLGYKVQVITMDQVELSDFYRKITDSSLDDAQIQAYAQVIQNFTTETLSPDVLTARARHALKLALALSFYLKDLYEKAGNISWLLFVGDFDIVPSLFCKTTIEDLEFFSDLLFVMEDAEQCPIFAPIGRIPASIPEMVEAVCKKLMTYEHTIHQFVNASDKNIPDYAWLRRALIVVHEERDPASCFDKACDLISQYLKEKLPEVIVLDATTSTKADIIKAINDGVIFIDYFGHGSVDGWTAQNGIRIADIKNLTNLNKLPLVISMSCYTGSIHNESFTERMLESTAGAIGIIGPSTISSTLNYETFNLEFYKAIFEKKMNQVGRIFQKVFNQALEANAHLLEPYEPSEGERKKVEERGESIEEYIATKNKNRKRNYYFTRAQMLMQIFCGDPSTRLPFNLPASESDTPYQVPTELEPVLTEPLPPEVITLTPENIFQEFQKKYRKFSKIFFYPRDLAKISTLESSRITDYLFLSLNTLYYAHKRVNFTKSQDDIKELEFVQEPHPQPPKEILRSEQIFPIEGTQKEKTCQ